MKKYIACVRDNETKEIKVFEREYKNKKDFAMDLKGNGYSIRFISTEENFDEDCAKFEERMEDWKIRCKALYETYKTCGKPRGLTFKEWKEELKGV